MEPPWIQHGISLDDLFDNRAVWHKSCHLKFASSKLERVKSKGKRNANDQSSEGRRAPKTGSINKHTYNEKNTILALNGGMKNLKEALANRNFESQSLTLAKAKRSIRNDVFEEPECRFNGVFEPACQSRAVPGYQLKVFSLDAFKNECHQRLSKIGNGQTKPSLILCVSVTTILIVTVALPYSDVTKPK